MSIQPPAAIVVAIIDDHGAIHSGVSAWCAGAQPSIDVAASVFDANAFLAAQPVPNVDVVILDLELTRRLPDFAAVERITEAGYRVVVFSHLEQTEVILTCLDLGAMTYLVKSEGRRHLIEAIQATSADQAYIPPRMAGALNADRRKERPALAPREKEVLTAWFQTDSKELVAGRLGIAPATVRTHLQRIRVKYAAAGRPAGTKAALVARAIQDGIISVDEL